MEERLRSSLPHAAQMARAHRAYGQRRWASLTPEDRADVVRRGWSTALDTSRGVAGICLRDDGTGCLSVKCLHAHAAHYLAQMAEREKGGGGGEEGEDLATHECDGEDLNLVGQWTMESVLELIKSSKEKETEAQPYR